MKKPTTLLQKANQQRWIEEGQLLRDVALLGSMITRYNTFLKESDKNCIRQLMFTLQLASDKIRRNYKYYKIGLTCHGED